MGECSICLTENIIPLDKCITQCNHNYCKNCLDKWFNKGKNTCPMCRQTLHYFEHNGHHTRIISVELPHIRQPVNITHVTVTREFYQFMKITTMALTGACGLAVYVITQVC